MTLKAKARATRKDRTTRSIRIEAAIDILSDLLGSRQEVLATLTEILTADSEFTENQKRAIYEELKKMHGDDGLESYTNSR